MAFQHHRNGQYREAISFYTHYLTLYPEHPLAINGLSGCAFAETEKQNSSSYKITSLPEINSRFRDFSPVWYGKEYPVLYFISSRAIDKNEKHSRITGVPVHKLFQIRQTPEGKWEKTQLIETLSTPEEETGPCCFSGNGQTNYYTRTTPDPKHPVQIYVSRRFHAEWTKGRPLQGIPEVSCSMAHPALSPDGLYLYFASDIPGGYGGMDLYRARLYNRDSIGPWENAGSGINTAGDEMYPSITQDGILYFSSNGHPGLGGLDLFRAIKEGDQWIIQNMGMPFNSPADDFGICWQTAEKGFFSSARTNARGYEQIYFFERIDPQIKVHGTLYDREGNPLSDGEIRLISSKGENRKLSLSPNGYYSFALDADTEYMLMASCAGYLNQPVSLRTEPEEKEEVYRIDFYLTQPGTPELLYTVFFDYNSELVRPDMLMVLEVLTKTLNEFPWITISIVSHTDRYGSEEYNQLLSEKRSEAVIKYLLQHGIPEDRLTGQGKGKQTPRIISREDAIQYRIFEEGTVLTPEYIETLPEQEKNSQTNSTGALNFTSCRQTTICFERAAIV